jgi:hypothetical protein
MPAIRDYNWEYETSTTNAGITIGLPAYEVNDLLIAFAMSDTGTPTWTMPSGFTQLFTSGNTIHTACAYRIATGTEPTSGITFGATVNETYNGACLSIRDVNTTNPFGNPSVFNVTTQASAAKFNMQTITTNVNNALVLVYSANSSPGVPSFIENQGMSLIAADGSAESMGIGWFFKPTTGTTPTGITCSNVSSGAGIKAVIQIAPPSTGATVIPTYIVEDTSTYLNPINGTTAFNGDIAFSASTDTTFGTTITGITNTDATVAAATDVGLNSFHSMVTMTTTANATNVYGGELTFATANRPNITGKNLLCHTYATSPLQLQRLPNVASRRGIWMGVRSSSGQTDYKIWEVLGSDSPVAANRPIPIIINEAAGNLRASSGTYNPASTWAVAFFVGAKVVGTTAWYFGSLWLMDKTTIAGGNSNEPISIESIVKTIANSHERKSAILQGVKQMLLLQDLQIGNGGSSPTYLDLDGTAIELPSQYNRSTKNVSYNSVDNKIGITYYAGSSDTIKHRNSVISSPSRYKWGFDASSSSGATYDFSGLSVIGAGTITMNNQITFDTLTINDYSTISASGATFLNSTFLNVPSSSDSISISSGTTFTGCTINVSRVTAGNYWVSVPSPTGFTNCSFIGGGGHAIRITTAGTYSFVGNTFSGFGATGTTGAAIYNDSGGLVTINISGGGDTPTYRNGTSASTVINNSVTLTLTDLIPDSEVRIYLTGTTTELGGTESSSDTFEFQYNYSPNTYVDIVIHKENYEYVRLESYLLTNSSTSIPVQQRFDRNYL